MMEAMTTGALPLTDARSARAAAGADNMEWVTGPRDPRLQGLVRCHWMIDIARVAGARDRIVDAAVVELIFDLSPCGHAYRIGTGRFEQLPGCLINGLKTQPVDLAFAGRQRFFGAQLASHAPRLLFGVSADELTGRVIAGDAFGHQLATLHGRLLDAPGFRERVTVLEAFLVARAAGRRLDPRVTAGPLLTHQALGAADPVAAVAATAAVAGLSPRHYLRRFREWHGLGPTDYRRLHRFVTALGAMTADARTLAEVATMAGYYDQAHMNREFRCFASASPGEYRRRRRGPPGHFVP